MKKLYLYRIACYEKQDGEKLLNSVTVDCVVTSENQAFQKAHKLVDKPFYRVIHIKELDN